MRLTRKCEHCSLTFYTNRPQARFHSRACANAAAYRRRHPFHRFERRECARCGESFLPTRAWQIYCCLAASRREYSFRYRHGRGSLRSLRPKPEFIPKKRICGTCPKEFVAQRDFQKYCSVRCAQTANRKRPGQYHFGPQECWHCRKRFLPERLRGDTFCSEHCRAQRKQGCSQYCLMIDQIRHKAAAAI